MYIFPLWPYMNMRNGVDVWLSIYELNFDKTQACTRTQYNWIAFLCYTQFLLWLSPHLCERSTENERKNDCIERINSWRKLSRRRSGRKCVISLDFFVVSFLFALNALHWLDHFKCSLLNVLNRDCMSITMKMLRIRN